MKNNKAFSLIELMVAVAIVGIVCAIAIPQYKQHVARKNGTWVEPNLIETGIPGVQVVEAKESRCIEGYKFVGPSYDPRQILSDKGTGIPCNSK